MVHAYISTNNLKHRRALFDQLKYVCQPNEGAISMTTEKTNREAIYSPRAEGSRAPIHPPIVRGGDFLFVSVIRGTDPQTGQVEIEEAEAQARQLFENLKSTLALAGAGLDDVVKVAVYMMDLNDRTPFNKVWSEYFGTEPPARFAVQVLGMGFAGDKSKYLIDATARAAALAGTRPSP